MECVNTVFPFILYILGTILLMVLIILGIKTYYTLKKIDKIIDDVNEKASKFNEIFSFIDNVTDSLSILNDKLVNFIVGIITNMFKKKKDRKEEEENE